MIRPLKITDLPQIISIETLVFSVPWSLLDFEHELNNPQAHYLVMEEQGKIIGYGGFWKILDEGHFTNVAITPEFQQLGLGRKLIEALLNYARSLEIERATLEVREGNVNAIKAYASQGFYIEGKRSRYYTNPTEDAIIMWTSLK